IQVYNTLEERTQAILEMVDGSRGGPSRTMTKLLKIWVSPEFWPADRDPTVRRGFVDLYAGILIHVIAKGISENINEIRIYARTDALHMILSNLQSEWATVGTAWTATMEGRWFVLLK